ncbi:hypothetical protein BKA70DRAFT_1258159 [Coprinopsis sp. MPI-PUGE-AT-0042]|nr:hypothetical protein BKA70DRAFT_1258159 [Coprinopsis sp. MPI-PUGE-AT-0042]
MALLLSMLRCSREEDPETTLYSLRTIANRTYPPGLIIIHEPSLYFTDADELSPHTLSSYLNLLVRAFSACRSLSSSGSPQQAYLVVFDSRLLELKLPLTRPPQSEMYRYQPTHTSEIKAVFESAEKLFEWVAYFELGEDEDTIPSSQGEDDEMTLLHTPAKQMRLCRVGSEYAEVFHWEEVVRMDKYNSQPSIHFVFKE